MSHLSEFISSVKPHFIRHGKNYVIETALEDIDDKRKGYGYNYWKSSLKVALINSPDFWDYLNDTKSI